MKTVNDIRSEFLNFFEGKGHERVASAPLIPQNDPTLMFVNSGMVPFKNLFTGAEKRDYTRATSAQKSVRAGGKHNDLENVGYTARHHTFFEMMGNFSFGDYFKEEAIAYAWELTSKDFALNQDRLLITVHSTDEEAADLWKKIAGFPDNKIIRIDTDDNFWRMGDTGPCGPCSEIFYDQGEDIAGGPPGSPDEDGDRFLEFWNLVFMQYEQIDADTRIDLPKPCIDTGMGLERMAAIMQGKTSNYDIDMIHDIIEECADMTDTARIGGEHAASHRVIADHLRASAFLLADGVMPSNEGRGYVLRRIMRRGMRHAHLLGAQDPLMHRLVPMLLAKMGEAYPELYRAEALIKTTLESEETRFKTTLERGLKILDEETAKLNSGKFPGETAFKLYDTFGFPLDLTQDALKAKGIEVDTDAFEAAMAEQRKAARAAWSGAGGETTDKLWFELLEEFGPTEFLGYDTEEAEGKILAIVKDGKRVDALKQGEEGIIITNQTPFYGESGGQVGDTGQLTTETASLEATTTKKAAASLVLHYVKCSKGQVSLDEAVKLTVSHTNRTAIRANHSATHLLHEALRQTLGEHVAQKGSLQDAERTRFDISQPNAITPDQIKQIETIVNNEITNNTKVETRIMPIDEARETGAMALFGEKYDDEVRVVFMGSQEGKGKQFSVELCGGTHVKRTGDIGLLKIISESALSSGVRRVEALTGARAIDYLETQENILQDAKQVLKASEADFLTKLGSVVEDKKKLEKELTDLRRQMATGGAGSANADIKDIGGTAFIGKVLDGFPPKDLKPMVDDLKAKIGSGIVALVATNEGKASIVVGVTDDLTATHSAVDLVKIGATALGGKGGGGRPDMAQAGGPDAGAANDAVAEIEKTLAS